MVTCRAEIRAEHLGSSMFATFHPFTWPSTDSMSHFYHWKVPWTCLKILHFILEWMIPEISMKPAQFFVRPSPSSSRRRRTSFRCSTNSSQCAKKRPSAFTATRCLAGDGEDMHQGLLGYTGTTPKSHLQTTKAEFYLYKTIMCENQYTFLCVIKLLH